MGVVSFDLLRRPGHSHQVGDPFTSYQSGVPHRPHGGLGDRFSPHGKTLASCDEGGAVRLWNVATGHQIGNHPSRNAIPAWSVVFSPDGNTLASSGADGKIQLWDVATDRQIGSPFTGHTDAVNSVAFSPDGKTLGSGSADGTVQLWDVAYTMDIVQQLCASAGRSLTRAVWAQYVPPGPAYRRVCP